MSLHNSTDLADFASILKKEITGEVRFDRTARLLYSTDASIYQIEPLGVAFPRNGDDLAACVEIAASYNIPVLARGAGSSLGGQAIGPALILDCSRYLYRQLEINSEERTAIVEPGVILNSLNRAASIYDLQFGPDPASGERATLGGSLANNASGAHSILYGMAADHLLSVDCILADGSQATFNEVTLTEARSKSRQNPTILESDIYKAALQIRDQFTGAIQQNWPRTWRRASGYNLNYLLPWSPSQPPQWDLEAGAESLPYPPVRPGHLNLAQLIAGSEGTLGVIRRATLRLVPRPQKTILGVLAFPSLVAACEAVPALLERQPAAVELIPESLIRLARSVPVYAHQLGCLDPLCRLGIPAAMLVVEFSGDRVDCLRQQALQLGPGVLLAETPEDQKQVWGVRKAGLGILMSRAGDRKPVPFIEDLAVPVERLGEFVREMERIFNAYETQGDFYAHASAGCLHIRPLLNLKSTAGVAAMRAIAQEAVALTIRLGGAPSGEHGDGLARAEWLEGTFGPELVAAFRLLKNAADPRGLLNPGKILDAPPFDKNLRYAPGYNPQAWLPVMDFSSQAGLIGAVEQCNGAGVCRKVEGVMCPSFQATGDEMHSTRGRANLLRAMFAGYLLQEEEAEETVHEALDLCLACKGCKAECPSAVDMAKLKYEFLEHYYRPGSGQHRPLRDYLFAYVGSLGRLGSAIWPLANLILRNPASGWLGERLLGVSRSRRLPVLSSRSLRSLSKQLEQPGIPEISSSASSDRERVLFLSDPFTEYFYPEIQAGLAALKTLREAGCQVEILPVIGAGRTRLSKGFVRAARRQASKLVAAIARLDPQGEMPVVGVEPSEIYTLRDEYPDLFPGDPWVKALASRAFMIDEFLVRPGRGGENRILRIANKGKQIPGERNPKVLLHGHCYQKAQPPASDGYPTGVAATQVMLEALGYEVSLIESGCCGMAGAFGYEVEHYDISMRVGELALLPQVRKASEGVQVAAAGISCQAQIQDGAGITPIHPIRLASPLPF